MSRKLISITDDAVESEESISKLKSWENDENPHVSKPSGGVVGSKAEKSERITSMMAQLEGKSGNNKKFEIFDTKKVSAERKLSKHAIQQKEPADESEKSENEEMAGSIKERRTIEEQKKQAVEREKKALEASLGAKRPEVVKFSNQINYESDKNISLESLKPTADDDKLKPQPASKTPSLILPQFYTKNFLSLIKPKTGVQLNPKKSSTNEPKKFDFDPREKQRLLDGKPVKVYKRGEKFFVRVNEKLDESKLQKSVESQKQIPLCRRAINVNVSQLNLLTPKKRLSTIDMTLGKPFGIQLGSHNILNDFKTMELKGSHALDVVIVAHGMSHVKHPANWSERDIDHILMMGAELHKATRDTHIDKLNAFTKGFTYKSNYIQVTMSEPIVIGKILTMTERSMDLYNGLQKFFSAYQQGIFETSNLALYIMRENIGFYVFDPRGRDEKCERNGRREAALMAFTSIMNVYHMILNLSGINTRAPFKISNVKVIQFMNKDYVLNEFTAVSGSGGSGENSCRNDEYEMLDEQIAYLRGNLSLNSPVFEDLRNRHGLTTSIMAIVYAKIDPPVSWCKSSVDRVLHFGHKFHLDCLENPKIVRNLTLPDIPSKFYVGDSYCIQIAIAAYFTHVRLQQTRFAFDNPITIALMSSLDSFRCLILEIDNCTFAVWRTEPAKIFYFFDPYQKNVKGDIDYYCGTSTLFVYETIDHLCEHLCERILRIQHSDSTFLKIHGMKIIELRKLTKREQKSKPILKMANLKCIRPFTADDVRKFLDVPSTVDSVAPLLTKTQQLKVLEKTPEKPLYQKITDLNSPSLVCCKMEAYDDIMASVEKKLSVIKQPEVIDKTMDIMREIHSEILHKIEKCNEAPDVEKCLKSKRKKESMREVKSWKKDPKTNQWTACGEYIGTAEKVLLKTDLECLERERDEILNQSDSDDDTEIAIKTDEIMTLSREKLIPSHFQEMPDKSQVVSGTKSLFKIQVESNIYDHENLSVIIGIAAILTSTKYSIATWSPETVDYVLGCGQIMSGAIKLKHRMDFYTVSEHILPNVHINDKFYTLQMRAIANGEFNMLENHLAKLFDDIDRFLIVTTCGSLAVFKRKNFYYLFEYATCNMVGYRIRNDDFGTSCFLRFDNLHSLIRRIHANHFDVKDEQKFIIYRVMVNETRNVEEGNDERLSYIPFSQSQEKIIIDALRHNRMVKREEMIKKLRENDEKIRDEKERIKKYRAETGLTDIPPDMTENDLQHTDFDETKLKAMRTDDFELDLSAYNKSTDDANNNDEKAFMSPIHQNWIQSNQLSGYDDNDGRIRGTFGYENRMQFDNDNKLRECHFACIYSIMYAVHHPFSDINYRGVDVILENGMRIYESIDVENYQKTMALTQMNVESMSYDLRVSEFIVRGRSRVSGEDFQTKVKNEEVRMLNEFFTKEKYGIIQAANCCIMVMYDKKSRLFHIFDPYDAEDTNESNESTENPIGSFSKHKSIEDVHEYLTNRVFKTEQPRVSFKIYHVLIESYRNLKKTEKTGYFIFAPSARSKKNVELKSCKFVDLSDDEKIEWLTETCIIPWSRLEKNNADGMRRYTKETKWKEYDIEMDMKLYSLWGNVHPNMKVFKQYAGKQHLACCVVALIMSNLYNIDEWDSVLLDSIISHGHKYLVNAVRRMRQEREQLEVTDLNGFCHIQNFGFNIDLELFMFGRLYDEDRRRFNLNRALDFAFRQRNLPGVILLCNGRSLAVGNADNQNYFMYDCQSYGVPLFKENQGTSYVLKCCCMKVLIACIILTLNVRRHNVKFYLYALEARQLSSDETAKMKEDEEQAVSDVKSVKVADSN